MSVALTSHDPRFPYDVACISFSVLAPPEATPGQYVSLLEDALHFNPALNYQQMAILEFNAWASIGRKAHNARKRYRVINMAVRVCSKVPWDPEEAQPIMESLANQMFDIPDTVLGSPLLANTGIVTWNNGVPIPDVTSMKVVLQSLRISLNGKPDTPLHSLDKTVQVPPPADLDQSLHCVLTSRDVKRIIPYAIFRRFFNEKPSVWGYKTYKDTWRVLVPTEGPDPEGRKHPPSLQNFARLGVLEQCLKMKREGRRYAPY